MSLFFYIKKIILSDSKESSKRFIAIYSMLLVTFVVIAYTNKDNSVMILGTLCGFILTLAGVASWQAVKTSKTNKINKDENRENT